MSSKGVTPEQIAFLKDVRARDERLRQFCLQQGFTNKRTGRTSYYPAQVAHLNPPTNEERALAEVIEFYAAPPTGTYCAYLSSERRRITVGPAIPLLTCKQLRVVE